MGKLSDGIEIKVVFLCYNRSKCVRDGYCKSLDRDYDDGFFICPHLEIKVSN